MTTLNTAPALCRPFAARRSATTKRRATAIATFVLGAAAAFAAPSASAAPEVRSIDFLPAVQGIGQNARVLLVNLTPVGPRVNVPPGPCRVAVNFLDANGDAVGPAQLLAIARGRTATVAAPVFVTTGLPTTLRAHVEVIQPPGPPVVPPDPCAGLHGSYEVFDTQTLETKFVNPGAIRGFNPQPDPPGTVGR